MHPMERRPFFFLLFVSCLLPVPVPGTVLQFQRNTTTNRIDAIQLCNSLKRHPTFQTCEPSPPTPQPSAYPVLPSYFIDYKQCKTSLCTLGAYYDTDKSSQRVNASLPVPYRHCHPYTLYYDTLFRQHRTLRSYHIGEFGLFKGSSLRMWRDYFPTSQIDTFEYNQQFIHNFRTQDTMERVYINEINVKNDQSINTSVRELVYHHPYVATPEANRLNVTVPYLYDLLLDDSTHVFEDMVRIVRNSYTYLKPGGMLIIEDVRLSYYEKSFTVMLHDILDQFQLSYWITLDHERKNSFGWDNDKMLILIKKGAPSLFGNTKKLSVITTLTSSSSESSGTPLNSTNLVRLSNSIDFHYIDEWIIVYDGKRVDGKSPNLFRDHPSSYRIKELVYNGNDSASRNAQRNYGLHYLGTPHPSTTTRDTFLYYMDDDNIFHPNFWGIMISLNDNMLYTFDQTMMITDPREGKETVVDRKGDTLSLTSALSIGSFIVDYGLCRNVTWNQQDPQLTDKGYIEQCYANHRDKWVYIRHPLAYY